MDDTYMRRAIEIGRSSLGKPGTLPYGAVVVLDGRIVGEGLNRSLELYDPTSHGEVEAIRDACRKLGRVDLAGADLYTSCEPCAMCVATMYLSGIARLFYAGTASDSATAFAALAAIDPKWTRRISAPELRREVGLEVGARRMPGVQLLGAEGQALLGEFLKSQQRT